MAELVITLRKSELRRRRRQASCEQRDDQDFHGKTLSSMFSLRLVWKPESSICLSEMEEDNLLDSMPNREWKTPISTWCQDLELKHLTRIDLSRCIKILPNSIFEMISKLKHLKYFEHEPLFPPEVERNDMPSKSSRINREKFPPLPEKRDAEHDSSTLRRLLPTPIRKQREVDDYKKKKIRQLEGYNEVKIMIETGCAPGNPAEDVMKPKREMMAILVTNMASIVLFALMVFASIESKSLSIIASILDPFFDLLWGFILWLTSYAVRNPNQHKYPVGMKRLQPVGMIVFGSFGLQLLFQAAKQFITKSEPGKDPQKEKWMIGVMTFVTMVQFMLAFYCRRFENKILRAYAEHHSSNVITNLISVAAAVLAIRYYWWIDPTGAIIILLYTMNTWKKTFFENLFVLIGRTAPPEILEKVKTLIFDHHDDIKEIGRLGAYTFVSDEYFVEVDIVLPQDINRRQAHVIGEILQVKLERLPEVARAFVHIDFEDTHRVEHRPMV